MNVANACLEIKDGIVTRFHPKVVNVFSATVKRTRGKERVMDRSDSGLIRNSSCQTSLLDYIAQGVEARFDLLMGFTQLVIGSTAAIAKDLDIPEDHIRGWVKARQEQRMSRISRIYFLLDKLERDPRAQVVLGLTRPYQSTIDTIQRS
jgi:hypothetical protein